MQLRFLLAVVLAVSTMLASSGRPYAQAAAAAPTADWPQWRGVNRDGRVPALPRTMPPMKLLWKQPVAGICDAGIAVAGGLIFVADHDGNAEHDGKNDFYRCLSADKGAELWVRTFPNSRTMDYGAGPRATPLVYRDKLYTLGAFGELRCFELKTGKTVWEKDLVKDFGAGKEPKWGYCSSPLVAGGKLIVNPGGKAAVAALDPETGKVLWQSEGGKPNYSSFIAGTFGGVEQVIGHEAIGHDEDALCGRDLATGKRLWSVPMEHGGEYIVPTPVNVGGKLLVTDEHNETQLFAFGPGGMIVKEPVAKSEDIAPDVITPVAVGDLVLGVSKKLVCLDAGNELNTLWTSQNETTFRSDCHLIVAQDVGLAFSSKGIALLFSFDRQGVKILGKTKLTDRTLMHPTVVGQRLYVRDSESLYCYDLSP